jgi:hypothetical protein
MPTERITYQQLDDLLVELGFARQTVEPKWLRYEHTASDTTIVVVRKRPDALVRITDVVSARRHLIEKGLISEEEFEALLLQTAPKPVSAKKN